MRAGEFLIQLTEDKKTRIFVERDIFEDELQELGVRSNAFLVSTRYGEVVAVTHEATGKDALEYFDKDELVEDIVDFLRRKPEIYYDTGKEETL